MVKRKWRLITWLLNRFAAPAAAVPRALLLPRKGRAKAWASLPNGVSA
jgi:hypothetical protein